MFIDTTRAEKTGSAALLDHKNGFSHNRKWPEEKNRLQQSQSWSERQVRTSLGRRMAVGQHQNMQER